MAITYKAPITNEITISCNLTTSDIATLMVALTTATKAADYQYEKSEYKALSRDLSIALTLALQNAEQCFDRAKVTATHEEEKLTKAS
jgi:hypothetical protein